MFHGIQVFQEDPCSLAVLEGQELALGEGVVEVRNMMADIEGHRKEHNLLHRDSSSLLLLRVS